MSSIFVENLFSILREELIAVEENFTLEVNPDFLDEKGKNWLQEIFEELSGQGSFPQLEKVKFDLKINRTVVLFDFELNFNRYRLKTFRSGLYENFQFPFVESHKRLCRTYEKECMKAGLQARYWNGPPVATQWFGDSEEIGDFSGNGSSGWKLRAYNDSQIDLLSRIHGFKLIRISPYETLMTGGALRRLDQLLMNPKEEQQKVVLNWLIRKLEIDSEKKNQL
ncbi:DUF7255 family protein [Algoriphagus hitonicola]|uniref:Uncharacterized protein n=1 Tax=Algoriphagus hitonicola TaxID=435880 RepID=A0A1I2R8P5_9BACT|nr:hypothetical protein [Algoriphagus hitonicola]SFG34231.1 hypothetical protein SAMN04487988_10320 [Algoriphagus hitonicola]